MLVNTLFWIQVVFAYVNIVPQMYNIYIGKTDGLTLALYVIFIAYMFLCLSLSWQAYKIKKDKERKYLIIIFVQWIVLLSLTIIIGIDKIIWTKGDTITCIVVFILSISTIIFYRGLSDPICRGYLAIWFKALPQLWLAITICLAGSSIGIPLVTLFAGYATSLPRISQIIISGIRGGWDRPIKG